MDEETVLPFTGPHDSVTVSFCCHPVVRNCHTDTFVYPLCVTCWNMLQCVALAPNGC
jgi:hypothetical protein